MGTTERISVFLSEGRLYPVKSARPTGHGPWPRIKQFKVKQLVIRAEGGTGTRVWTEGPSYSPELFENAILLAEGKNPSDISPDVWRRVPLNLRRSIEKRVETAKNIVTTQLASFSNEEAVSGAFFSQIGGPEFAIGGWRAKISFVEFSKQVKEPLTGTDVAIIVDVLASDGKRSFKTMWFQAKLLPSAPDAHSSPPRMREQLRVAHRYCDASFGLVYSPEGIFVMDKLGVEPEPIEQTLDRCMRCEVGDFAIAALMNSMNRKYLQVNITEGPIPGQRRIRVGNP